MEKIFFIIFKYFFVLLHFVTLIKANTDYGKCVDPKCTVPIGQGVTITKYYSPSFEKLSFLPNEIVDIYVKEYGSKKELCGVMKNGQKGYISKKLIKEIKTFHRILQPAQIEFITGTSQPQILQNYRGSLTQNLPNQGYSTTNEIKSSINMPQNSIDLNKVVSTTSGTKFHKANSDDKNKDQEVSFPHKSQEALHVPQSSNLHLDTLSHLRINSHISNHQQSQNIYQSLSSLESQILMQSRDSGFGSVVDSRMRDKFKRSVDNLSPTSISGNKNRMPHEFDYQTGNVFALNDKQLEETILYIRNICAGDQKCLNEYLLNQETTNTYSDSSQVELSSQNRLSSEDFISPSIQPNIGSPSNLFSNSDENIMYSKSIQDHSTDYSIPDNEEDLDDESEIEDYDDDSYEPFEPSSTQRIDITKKSSYSNSQPNIVVQTEKENDKIKPISSSTDNHKKASNLNDLSKSESIHQKIKETNIPSLIESFESSSTQESMGIIKESSYSDSQSSILVQTEKENKKIKPTSSSTDIHKEASKLNDLSKSESFHQKITETNMPSLIEPFESPSTQKSMDNIKASSHSDSQQHMLVQEEIENNKIKPTSSSTDNHKKASNINDLSKSESIHQKIKETNMPSLIESFESSLTQESMGIIKESSYSDSQSSILVQNETENIKIKPTSSSLDIHKEASKLNDLSKSESIHQEIKETNISSLIEPSINLFKEKDINLQPEFHSPSNEYINKKLTDVKKASIQNVQTQSTKSIDISQTPVYDKMSNQHVPNKIVDDFNSQKKSLKTDDFHLNDNQFQNEEQQRDKNIVSLDSSSVANSVSHSNLKLYTKTEQQTDSNLKYNKEINPDLDNFHSNLISEEPKKNYLSEKKLDKILQYDFDDNMSFIHDKEKDNEKQSLKEDNINNISELEPKDADNLNKNPAHFDSNISIEEALIDISDLYHIRQLKEESTSKISQDSSSEFEAEENLTNANFNAFENSIEALRSFLDHIILWIPEPIYSYIMDYDVKGLSARVTVFTALSSIPCFFIFVSSLYFKKRSKESKLLAELIIAEKNIFSLSAEKIILDEQLQKTHSELIMLQQTLDEGSLKVKELQSKLDDSHDHTQDIDLELKNCLEEIDLFKDKEDEYITLLSDLQKEKIYLQEQNEHLQQRLTEEEDKILELTNNLQQNKKEIQELSEEKQNLLISQNESSEKLIQLQQNCNQLLQEAEVWNLRVNELTSQLEVAASLKEELENSNKTKDEEIESLKYIIDSLQAFESEENSEDSEAKTKEEKLQTLMETSKVKVQLQKEQAENVLLSEKLSVEKTKALDMEVELLEAKSEIDKLRINYNQALQDKAEAQTKLNVLTNYFKDKELQLQKELGAQEAVRQKKEDASSAERKISLIEKENESYKYQVASMKQEMEETERNLKSQIAMQEQKTHENWLAARAAERKLEDTKQEITQLRQKLTLLEREQQNWLNSQDEVIRPVPKRFPGTNDDTINSQDSIDLQTPNIFRPSLPHERLPPLMMLPSDRPLPPLSLPPPPPMPPPYLPHPMDPLLPPPFPPQPWRMPPESIHGTDFRSTPSEINKGRESTPSRERHSQPNNEMRHTSSPLSNDNRDSCNSTPPHNLPHFHNIPPRPYFPPPMHFSRYPPPPPPSFRRMHPNEKSRQTYIHQTDSVNSSSQGSQDTPLP